MHVNPIPFERHQKWLNSHERLGERIACKHAKRHKVIGQDRSPEFAIGWPQGVQKWPDHRPPNERSVSLELAHPAAQTNDRTLSNAISSPSQNATYFGRCKAAVDCGPRADGFHDRSNNFRRDAGCGSSCSDTFFDAPDDRVFHDSSGVCS